MAKKKDPYSRIQERFVESRLEERGWDEMDMDARERVSSRFNMLAQSIEGRGKIARQILGPESSPEQRKALKQRLRKNLPSKSGTGPQATDLNPTGPAASAVYAGRVGSPTTGRVNVRPTTTVQPRTTTSTNNDRSLLGKIYDFQSGVADKLAKVTDPLNAIMYPFSAKPREQAKAEGFSVPGLKESAQILGGAAVSIGPVASIGGRTIGGVIKSIKGGRLKGFGKGLSNLGPQTQRVAQQTAPARVANGVVEAVNETRPVASTVTEVVQTPATQTAATTATTATTGTKTRRTSSTKTKSKKTETPVAQVRPADVTPEVAVSTPSAPVKAPEIVQPNPVTPPTIQTPTPLQKTVTPEQFTQPVAPPATQPVTAPKAPVEIAGPTTPKPKGTKKGGKKKATPKTEEGVKIEVIKPVQGTPPATGEVVGGAAPKAPQATSSTPNLPTPSSTPVLKTGKSAKSQSGSTQPSIPTSSVIQAGTNPPVVVGKATAIPKQSGRNQVLKEPEIVSQTTYSDPTGWSKTGTVKKTVYKSQATEQAEAALKPKGVPQNTAREQATIELIEGAPGPLMPVPKKQAAKIEFIEKVDPKTGEKLAYPTPEGKKIQDQQLVMNDPRSKAEQSFVSARQQQLDEYADAARQERWELSPRRKTQRELTESMQDQPGKPGKSMGDIAREAQKEEMRRTRTQRRNLKTRRKPLSEKDPELRKQLAQIDDPSQNPNAWVEQTSTGHERVFVGTPEEAAARDPRTIEQIRESREFESRVGDIIMQPPATRDFRTAKQIRESLKRGLPVEPQTKLSRQQKNARKRAAQTRERWRSRQRDPRAVQQEAIERLERQKRMEDRARRMDRVEKASTRKRIKMEQRAEVAKGVVPEDLSPGLRQTFTFEDIDIGAPRTRESAAVDQFMDKPREIRVDFDDSVFNRPVYGPDVPAPLPGAKELPYAEKFGPAQMTYEELLKVEATGQYRFVTEKSPFTRRTSGGKFVLQEGKLGVTMDSIRSTNVTPKELRRLIASTSRKASE